MVASATEQESPWADPEQMLQMEALAIFEANLCPDCGRPLDVCGDPDVPVMVDDRVCMFTRAVEVARHWDETNHKRDKRSRGLPFWSDGLSRVPRPMTDDEIAQSRPSSSLVVGGADA